jgi:hypothetical protein
VVSVSGTGDLPVVPSVSDHPDHDLLADLAADVLDDDLAGQVQSHVIDCPSCAGLLAEAEGIRSWLRQGEPERMPDDVLERLEAALAAVAPAGSTPSTGDVATPDVPTPAGGVSRGASGVGSRRLTPALPKNRAVAPGDTGRLTRITTRVTTPTESARRQAREEQLADRPSLLTRFAPLLKAAAAVVVLLGAGGFVWNLTSGSSDTTTSADSSAAAASSAPVLAPVQATGTNYDDSDLRKQVDALIGASQRAALKAPAPSSADRVEGTAQDSAASPFAAASSDLLKSPPALRACLSAIGADDDQPVAVDLARWAGRDAAIIVLNADGGGYDVWVVARTCAPDADGTIAQEHIDS